MPLPKRKKDETKSDFISRCMSDKVVKKEFPDNDQCAAVCNKLAVNAKKTFIEVVTGTSITKLTVHMSKLIRKDTYDGVEYLVCPVIMMTPGVRNGILYLAEELSKFPEAWNGQAVPIYHPTGREGDPISVNDPKVLEQYRGGWLFNVKWEDEKLKGEIWIDPERANRIDPRLMEKIENEEPIDVSIGVWQDEEMVNGELEGSKYHCIARNLRPDHLALLPDEEGACSWEDGAGIPRINSKGGIMNRTARRLLAALGFRVEQISMDALYQKATATIREQVGNDKTEVYIIDLYEDHVVFETWEADQQSLYKQSYVIKDDEVILVDDKVQVKLERKYVPVIQEKGKEGGDGNVEENDDVVRKDIKDGDGSPTKNKKGSDMDREAKILELLATDKWVEADKEFLEGLSDERLVTVHTMTTVEPDPSKEALTAQLEEAKTKLKELSKEEEKKEKEKEEEKKEKEKEEEKEEKETSATVEDFMKSAPPEIATFLTEKLAESDMYCENMRAYLSVGDDAVYTKEELAGMNAAALEKLVRLSNQPLNFAGRGGGRPIAGNSAGGAGKEPETAPEVPVLFAKKTEEKE